MARRQCEECGYEGTISKDVNYWWSETPNGLRLIRVCIDCKSITVKRPSFAKAPFKRKK
jgi:hypothetical protein